MKNIKIILIAILVNTCGFAFAQKAKMPADFRLEYKYNAGMVQLREDLKLFSGNGTYKAFENGKDFDIKFTSKNKEEIQELHGKLSACGFFGLSLKADERYLNPNFGGNLRKYLFEQINSNTTDFLKEDIQTQINLYFPNVIVASLDVVEYTDTNQIVVTLKYTIADTNISDQLDIAFN